MASDSINYYKIVLLGEGEIIALPCHRPSAIIDGVFLTLFNTLFFISIQPTGRVGKTSIVLRYIENSYLEGRSSTLQASYFDKHIVIDENKDETNYRTSSSSYESQRASLNGNRNRQKREAQLSIWDVSCFCGNFVYLFVNPFTETSNAFFICWGKNIDSRTRTFSLSWPHLLPRCQRCNISL